MNEVNNNERKSNEEEKKENESEERTEKTNSSQTPASHDGTNLNPTPQTNGSGNGASDSIKEEKKEAEIRPTIPKLQIPLQASNGTASNHSSFLEHKRNSSLLDMELLEEDFEIEYFTEDPSGLLVIQRIKRLSQKDKALQAEIKKMEEKRRQALKKDEKKQTKKEDDPKKKHNSEMESNTPPSPNPPVSVPKEPTASSSNYKEESKTPPKSDQTKKPEENVSPVAEGSGNSVPQKTPEKEALPSVETMPKTEQEVSPPLPEEKMDEIDKMILKFKVTTPSSKELQNLNKQSIKMEKTKERKREEKEAELEKKRREKEEMKKKALNGVIQKFQGVIK